MPLADAEAGNTATMGNAVMIDSTNAVIILRNHRKVGRFGDDILRDPSFFQNATPLISVGLIVRKSTGEDVRG
jgi:hypothetical protein